MIGEDDSRVARIFIIIAFIIILVVILGVTFSNNQLKQAYINNNVLNEEWIENLDKRDFGSQFFNLYKWGSITYEINFENYTIAYLTVTTIKNLFMMDEKEIFDKTEDIIQNTFDDGFNIDNNTKITGKRILKNGHQTMYIIYNGTNISKNPNENIKIIGEVWNCGKSSTSIICLGYAQITDNKNNNANIYINYWQKIIGDEQGTFGIKDFQKEDGLIFNVICH